MFTGIVKRLGIIEEILIKNDSGRIIISIEDNFEQKIKIGDSIAVNGTCLTVSKISNKNYFFDVLSETFSKTNLKDLKSGNKVNLESGLAVGDVLGGHIVTGHIDCTGSVTEIKEINRDWKFTFSLPKEFIVLLVMKGSITVDGVSLTVAEITDKTFSVYIIPHTFENTIFSNYDIGKKVNLEMDLLGKYVQRILKHGGDNIYQNRQSE